MPKTPRKSRSLVIVHTGNGKGKTTAALGLLLRAWGYGLRVVMLQFIKNSRSDFGEHRAARKIGIEIIPRGAGFTWVSQDLSRDAALAQEQWALAKGKIASGEYDVVVLDEITYPLKFGWIETADLIACLRGRPENVHVVVTGRDAPQELIDFADLVTDMRDVKHPFENGLPAVKGIDF